MLFLHLKLKAFILTTHIYTYLGLIGLIFKLMVNELETKAMFIIYCQVLQNTACQNLTFSISGLMYGQDRLRVQCKRLVFTYMHIALFQIAQSLLKKPAALYSEEQLK